AQQGDTVTAEEETRVEQRRQIAQSPQQQESAQRGSHQGHPVQPGEVGAELVAEPRRLSGRNQIEARSQKEIQKYIGADEHGREKHMDPSQNLYVERLSCLVYLPLR